MTNRSLFAGSAMQRRVEAMSTAAPPLTDWPAQDVRLSSLSEARLGKLLDCILCAILVYSDVDCAKRAAANLLFDGILVDSVLSTSIVLTSYVFRSSVEGFL